MLQMTSYVKKKIIIITHQPNKEAIFNDGVSAVRHRVPGCVSVYHVRQSRLPADKRQITLTPISQASVIFLMISSTAFLAASNA